MINDYAVCWESTSAPVRMKMDLVVPKHEVLVTEWEFLIFF